MKSLNFIKNCVREAFKTMKKAVRWEVDFAVPLVVEVGIGIIDEGALSFISSDKPIGSIRIITVLEKSE